jgi:hypothetical protein
MSYHESELLGHLRLELNSIYICSAIKVMQSAIWKILDAAMKSYS